MAKHSWWNIYLKTFILRKSLVSSHHSSKCQAPAQMLISTRNMTLYCHEYVTFVQRLLLRQRGSARKVVQKTIDLSPGRSARKHDRAVSKVIKEFYSVDFSRLELRQA